MITEGELGTLLFYMSTGDCFVEPNKCIVEVSARAQLS